MKQGRKRSLVRHGGRSGFTLIEIMLVVVIIGILATVAAVNLKGKSTTAKITATRVSIGVASSAIDAFEVNCGSYPNSLDELINNPGNDAWQGPYIKGKTIPKDGWGKDLQYSKGEDDYKVWAEGPNGKIESQ